MIIVLIIHRTREVDMLRKQLSLGIRQIAGLAALSLIVGLSGCGATSPNQAASPSSASRSSNAGKASNAGVKEIVAANVPTIFAEATINPKLIDAVAKEANVKVADQGLFANGLGEKGSKADTSQKLLIANTKTIVEGLGGTYTPFQPKTPEM